MIGALYRDVDNCQVQARVTLDGGRADLIMADIGSRVVKRRGPVAKGS